jgi:hypothetical protein
MGLGMHKYTSFVGHSSQVRQLLSIEQGVVSLDATSVRLTNTRGVPLWTLSYLCSCCVQRV